MIVERFAPSPNGFLHLGHAYSALLAHGAARAAGGRFLVRLEDLDAGRARPEFEAAILEDLAWLGLDWEQPTLRQSLRSDAYAQALSALASRGLVYPCFCTRREIASMLSAPQEGAGPDGPAYPGTCRGLDAETRAARIGSGAAYALRLDMGAAIEAVGGEAAFSALAFLEHGAGPEGQSGEIRLAPDFLRHACGDVALARKDAPAAYHLAVVVDDAHQGVSCVTRGRDLFHATPVHRLLQALLGLPTPDYRHHRLIRDAHGRRLAKRDGDESLAALRARGVTPADIRRRVGLEHAD